MESATAARNGPSVHDVALVASWELIAADDLGESELEGRRIVQISAVAHLPGGDMRAVSATVHVTPRDFAAWVADVGGRRIVP